jgi:hypothetical protein
MIKKLNCNQQKSSYYRSYHEAGRAGRAGRAESKRRKISNFRAARSYRLQSQAQIIHKGKHTIGSEKTANISIVLPSNLQ